MSAVISICLNLSVEKYKNPLKAGFYVVELEGILLQVKSYSGK